MDANDLFVNLEREHPTEGREWAEAIHKLQYLLGMRSLRRDYPDFWARHAPEKPKENQNALPKELSEESFWKRIRKWLPNLCDDGPYGSHL
jgi:hypothetical protein